MQFWLLSMRVTSSRGILFMKSPPQQPPPSPQLRLKKTLSIPLRHHPLPLLLPLLMLLPFSLCSVLHSLKLWLLEAKAGA
jgi:hypothetical protein